MTVVIFMILNASSLDSCSPFVFRHQKYTVMTRAMKVATSPSGR